MEINYDGRKFRPIKNTKNGETSEDTIFLYKQKGNIITSDYSGGQIKVGHLIGIVDKRGNIDMRYHQVNTNDQIMTGICKSTPELLDNGKIRLKEKWQWTTGDLSKGTSILEEED